MGSTILGPIHNAAANAYNALHGFSLSLFFFLAVIQLVVVVVSNLIQQKDGVSLFAQIGKYIFILAFFDYFILNIGTLSMELLHGVIQLGDTASGEQISFTPLSLVMMSANWTGQIMAAVSNAGWFSNIGLTLLGLFYSFFILILMGLMAADLAVTYAKYYVLAAVSGVMLALGPLEFTRQTALNVFKALLGLILQLLTYYVLFSIFLTLSKDWAGVFAAYAKDIDSVGSIWTIPGEMVIFYLLAKNVPPFVAGLTNIGGFQNHGEAAVAAAAVGAGLAASAVTAPFSAAKGAWDMGAGTVAAAGAVGQGAASLAKATPGAVTGAAKGLGSLASAGANALSGGQAAAVGHALTAGGAGVKAAGKMALEGVGNTASSISNAASGGVKSLGDVIQNRNS
tara:strand:- start:34743 stop:35933 length:1191 start_codon:yes stop_codon:yes gene_type:complete